MMGPPPAWLLAEAKHSAKYFKLRGGGAAGVGAGNGSQGSASQIQGFLPVPLDPLASSLPRASLMARAGSLGGSGGGGGAGGQRAQTPPQYVLMTQVRSRTLACHHCRA